MTLNNWLCKHFDMYLLFRCLICVYGIVFIYIGFITSFPLMFILGILAIVFSLFCVKTEIAKCELKEKKVSKK